MVHISHSFKKWKKFMIDNHAKNYENNMCILRESFDIWKELVVKSPPKIKKKISLKFLVIFMMIFILCINFYFAKLNQT